MFLTYHLERFKLLIGIASLGAATAILVLSNRKGADRQGLDMFLRLVPLILASVFSFHFPIKPSHKEGRDTRILGSSQTRTG